MMSATRIRIECTYCGDIYYKLVYSLKEGERCRRCNDLKLKVCKQKDYIIDSYTGSPPFPEQEDPFDLYKD